MSQFIETAPLPLVIVLLLVGFGLLIKGADFFVEGSSSVAKRLHIPSIIIGLTIVAMGTSLPETAVSVSASIAGKNTLAVSNVVGSNIFNLMVVIGVCALLTPVAVGKDTIRMDIPFSAICAILLLGLGILGFADPDGMTLGHLDGVLLLLVFIGYLVVLVKKAMASRRESQGSGVPQEEQAKQLAVPLCILYIIGGAAAIAFGGELTVETASRVATACGMSQTLVGLTIVSIGTSLPELVTSIVAARKKEVDMAMGNAIGSNIFNILMVLGIASSISPIAFIMENVIDIVILLGFSLLVWVFSATKQKITRLEGMCMVALYAGYAVYISVR